MGGKGMVALGVATIALLAGPGTAWGNQEGKAGDSAPVAAPPAAEPVTPAGSEDADTATTPADEPVVAESSSPATEESTTESTEAPVPEPEAAASEATTATTASQAQVEGQSQAQLEVASTVTKRLGASVKAKKAARKAMSCATKAAQPVGNGPPPPGCTRIDGGQVNGVHQVVVNGVTITFTFTIVDTPSGPVITWTSDVPFSGTIYVKGGPDWPGFPCTYANATADASGNCHAPVNPHNNKFYGVSHITLCPPDTPIPPPITPPAGGSGGGAGVGPQGTAGKEQKGGVGGSEAQGTSPAVASAAVATAAARGEQLPFTGLNALWLVLIGGMLLGVGTVFRARRS